MKLPRVGPRAASVLFALLAIFVAAPAWIVRYPPLQDLPFHAATIRVLHSYRDPAYGFMANYDLTLIRTQYVLYYVLGSLMSYVVGVKSANIALLCIYLGGTPLSIRALLLALHKDQRICLFSIPLLIGPMFIFGLLPFLFSIPVFFWTLATCVRYLETPTRDLGIKLGILTFALFYSHLFTFGLLLIAYAALFPWAEPRRWIRAAVPALPAALVFVVWLMLTRTGALAQGALRSDPNDAPLPLHESLTQVSSWLTDIFADHSDTTFFVAIILVALVAVGLAQGDKKTVGPQARILVVLPVVCLLLYFMTGQSRAHVWLFCQRFPMLGLLTAVPLLPMPSGWRGTLVTVCALAAGVGSTVNTCRQFLRFQHEVGDIDAAIQVMEPRKKVAALVYDRGSKVVNPRLWAPFLHFGAYYQVEKGGLIQFSYAGWSHWPFDYKPGHIPAPGTLPIANWEWMPERVQIEEVFPYYDYVLTRGEGFIPPEGTFHLKWSGDRWAVWERDESPVR